MENDLDIEFVYSPNQSSRNGSDIDGIIVHFTRGGDATSTVKWFKNKDAKASAHYIVSRSGKIYQMVKEEKAAWHAGSPTTKPSLNGRTNLNSWTIGIEFCNWGPLYKATHDEKVTLVNGTTAQRKEGITYCAGKRWTMPYVGEEPAIHHLQTEVILNDRWWPGGQHIYLWEPYSKTQLNIGTTLIKQITDYYPHITDKWIARHQDVDPARKLDTGPAFPFVPIIKQALKSEQTEDLEPGYQLGKDHRSIVSFNDMEELNEPRVESKKKGFLCF